MGVGNLRRVVLWSIVILFAFSLSACTEGLSLTPTPNARSYPVDPIFKEFYDTLGGHQVLGPAISPLQIRDNLQCQYAERSLMCFDPNAIGENRYSLYPLGSELGIAVDTPVNTPVSENARVVDGIVIYEKFLPLYDRLYGARYVGSPLTQLRINQDYQRAEQFFENVGFYQNLNDPNGPVFLIPYGAYLCGGGCSYRLDEYWAIVKSNTSDQPFAASIARLGGPSVFGTLLLKPRMAEDGNLEQVYSNAAFYAPQDNPEQVRLRPLSLILGYQVEPLVPMVSHNQLVFYEVQDGLGHNVPLPFDRFVAQHGGRELSGNPISEVYQLPGLDLYRQCFENYCLLYDPTAADGLKVRMLALGDEYVKRFPPAETLELTNFFSPERISLIVATDKPNIGSAEPQTVRMQVQTASGSEPLERVEATLVLNIPDQPSVRYPIPPTDINGLSSVTIPPVPGVANGSRLAYQVCLNLPSETPICVIDSYLIWDIQ